MMVRFFPLTTALNPDSADTVGKISSLATARIGTDQVKGRHGHISIDLGIEIAHPYIQYRKFNGRPHALTDLRVIRFPPYATIGEKHRKVSEVMADYRLVILRVNGRIVSLNGCAHICRIVRHHLRGPN